MAIAGQGATQPTQTGGAASGIKPEGRVHHGDAPALESLSARAGSVFDELIAGRVFVRMVSSESVSSPRPPPATRSVARVAPVAPVPLRALRQLARGSVTAA